MFAVSESVKYVRMFMIATRMLLIACISARVCVVVVVFGWMMIVTTVNFSAVPGPASRLHLPASNLTYVQLCLCLAIRLVVESAVRQKSVLLCKRLC